MIENLILGRIPNEKMVHVGVPDPEKLKHKEFRMESDLCEYIERNIERFCIDVLDDVYVSHEREVQEYKHTRFQPRQPRVDFLIRCHRQSYLVEIKNPKNRAENRWSIGQILAYSTMLDPDGEMGLVVITTSHDMLTARAIKKFNLPIRYIYFEKSKFMEYVSG